nr:MAG TPA: PPPDE putative peptidase domain [Caudoviricetes sp.]
MNCNHWKNFFFFYLVSVSSTPRWVASYGSSPCTGIFV